MKNTVGVKNFVGGFLGGVFGILASWYAAPIVLPFGVCAGVALGWYFKEAVNAFSQARRDGEKVMDCIFNAAERAIVSVSRLCGFPETFARKAGRFIRKALLNTIEAIISAPHRFLRWQASHPMNRAQAIVIIVSLTYTLLIPIAVACLIPGMTTDNRFCVGLLGCLAAIAGPVVFSVRNELGKNPELNELNSFYRHWSVISRFGSGGLTIYLLGVFIRYSLGTILFAAFMAVMAGIAFTFGLVGFALLVVFVGAGELLYQLVSRTGHWLCLIITLVATLVSWIVYHDSFADQRILWLVALGTGVVSGGMTEFLRRAMVTLGGDLANREAHKDWIDLVLLGGKEDEEDGYIGFMMKCVGGFWCRQNRIARALRSLCFGTPVAQPVKVV